MKVFYNLVLLGIWLTASDRFLQKRIYIESNFYNLDRDEKYLIQFYNKRIMEKVKDLGLRSIDLESGSRGEELAKKSLKSIEIS